MERVLQDILLTVTYKLSFPANELSEQDVRTSITQAFQRHEVKPGTMRFLTEEGMVLVSIIIQKERVDNVEDTFPIASGRIQLRKKWIHCPGRQSVALLHNPPHNVTAERVEDFLEAKEIDADVARDDEGIKVVLHNATDLPYLVSKTHTIRRNQVTFQEHRAPMEPDDNLRMIDIEESLPLVVNQEAPPPDGLISDLSSNGYRSSHSPIPEHRVSMSSNTSSSGRGRRRAVRITGAGMDFVSGDFFENSLKHRFSQRPYFLEVDQIYTDGSTAFITFTTEEGINRLEAQPLTHLLGCPVQCTIVPLESIPEFQKSKSGGSDLGSPVLVIKDLPIGHMPEAQIERSLKIQFKIAGHKVKSFIIKGNVAQVTFEDNESVRSLVTNPPDDSTLLGRPITYSLAAATPQEPVDPQPHVLVVENLPPVDDIDEDFKSFISETTRFSITSCQIKDGKGYLQFDNPEDARKVVEAPPSTPFYGNKLKMKLKHSESVPDEMSDYKSREGLQPPPAPRTKTSPAAVRPPTIKPRSTTDSVIIKNIPAGENEDKVLLYLQLLCGVKCSVSKKKDKGVIIKFANKIDVKLLKEKAQATPYPEGNVQLIIEPYRSSSATLNEAPPATGMVSFTGSIVISGLPRETQDWVVKMYLGNLELQCQSILMTNEGTSAIVKLNTETDIRILQERMKATPLTDDSNIIVEPYTPPDATDGPDAATPTNTTKHNSGLSDIIIVKEIPCDTADYALRLYLEGLHGSQVCKNIQLNQQAGIAVVELSQTIDVKLLRSKALNSPFPKGNVVLHIDTLKPPTTVLIASNDVLPRHVVEIYCEQFGGVDCERFGGVDKIEEGDGGYIVTFNTRESQQKILKHQGGHIVGNHQMDITEYNPLLAPPRSPSPPPPLIPPRTMYTWPSYRKAIPQEAVHYYMYCQKEINEKLLNIEGKLHISAESLEVVPLAGASDIEDWDMQVRRVVETYVQDFISADINVPQEEQVTKAVNHIAAIKAQYPDLSHTYLPPIIKISGRSQTIRTISAELEKITKEEIKMTFSLEKPPRYIEYILKFAKADIDQLRPPVEIEYKKERPGCVTVHGVRKSLDSVKTLAEKKINEAHTEIIPLTGPATKLLQSRAGRAKISEVLGRTEDSILYVFEKIDTHHDYQTQICILSPEQLSVIVAKKGIAELIEEKKIFLSPEEAVLCTSQEWSNVSAKLTTQHFINISIIANEIILLTGEHKVHTAVSDEISAFLHTQNAITDTLIVRTMVWQIASDKEKRKYIEKEAKKRKVKLTFPAKISPDQEELSIGLKGEARAVDNIKGQLKMLVADVKEKIFEVQPQVGLKKVIEKGMLKFQCNEIEVNHQVKIRYKVQEVVDPLFASVGGGGVATPNAPHCVIGANSPNGIKTQVYIGDPAGKKSDALAIFVCEATVVADNPVMMSLAAVGGAELRSSMEALAARRLIEATVHKSTSVGNLGYNEMYQVVLPQYSNRNPKLATTIEAALQVLFDRVSQNARDIVIAPLSGPPHNYPVEVCAHSLLKFLASANFGIYNDISVSIFIEKDKEKEIYRRKMQELQYTLHYYDESLRVSTSLKVELLNGDVTTAPTDVIVNSTSIDMRHDANAISKAIHKAAGDDLKGFCKTLREQKVTLQDGFVVSTPASGRLRCNKIIHAHVPGKAKNRAPTDRETGTMKKTVANCLKTAEEESQSSIAMAAFCLGIGNFTVAESAQPTLEAMKEFALSRPTNLKVVQIYVLTKPLYEQYCDFFSNYFAPETPVTKLDPTNGPEGISVTLQPALDPARRRVNTTYGGGPGQLGAKKANKVSFWVYGQMDDALVNAERDVHKFFAELIVDDMVDLGDMTNLLSQEDRDDIGKMAAEEDVEVNFQDRLNRVLIRGEERTVERVCNLIQRKVTELNRLVQELHLVDWLLINPDGTEEPYGPEPAQQLEVAYKKNERNIKLVIDSIPCTVDLIKMEEIGDISGTAKPIMRKRKVHVEYPASWDLSNVGKEVVSFYDVAENSDEYVKATKRFNDTIGNKVVITQVQRIQNPAEYTRYQSLKNTWTMLHGQSSVSEKELFHGTKRDKIEPICSTGFNRGYAADSNAARYGKGVYFALNASYSMQDKYSAAEKDGSKCILVCSLLVCKMTRGNEKMKVPPPIPDNPQILYDTLVENVQNPTIFVAMKDSQAYPKYLIVFKKA